MKKVLFLIAVSTLLSVLGTPKAQAQAYGYYFSSFQCDPVVCEEQANPAFQTYAQVDFYAQCQNSGPPINLSFSGAAKADIGVPRPCQQMYYPVTYVEETHSLLTDPQGVEYEVYYAHAVSEIFYASGTLAEFGDGSGGCDGSKSGSGAATQPC